MSVFAVSPNDGGNHAYDRVPRNTGTSTGSGQGEEFHISCPSPRSMLDQRTSPTAGSSPVTLRQSPQVLLGVGPPTSSDSKGATEEQQGADAVEGGWCGCTRLFGRAIKSLFVYKKDPHCSWRRFVVLAVFCVFSLSNAMQWLTYSPVPTQVRAFYGISTIQLNMLSTIYMIVYIALSFVSCLGLEKIGLRWCLVIGTGLNVAGALLKLVVGFPTNSYAVLLVAQLLNSFSQIFVLSVPPTLALVWYREAERGTATTVGSVANAMGVAIGMLIPPLWVREGTDLAEGFRKLFGLQLGLCALAFVGAVLFVPTPKYAPLLEGDKKKEEGETEEGQTRIAGFEVSTSGTYSKTPADDGETTIVASGLDTFQGHISVPRTAADDEDEEASPDGDINNNNMYVRNPLRAQSARSRVAETSTDEPRGQEHAAIFTTPSPSQALLLTPPGSEVDICTRGGGPASAEEVSPVATIAAPVEMENIQVARTTPEEKEQKVKTHLLLEQPARENASSLPPPQKSDSSLGFIGVLKALGLLIVDRDCLFCELGLAVSIGSVWAVNSLLAQLLAPINVSESDAGQMGFWNIIAGTIVAVIVGPLVDKFRVYKYPIIFLAVLNLACLSFIIMIIYLDDTVLGDPVSKTSRATIYALNVIAGVPQNVITPVGFEFLMELSFGHLGSVSGGLLMGMANAISLIEVSVGSELLGPEAIAPKQNALNAFWFVWALLVGGLVLLILPRNNLKRLAAQRKRESELASKA